MCGVVTTLDTVKDEGLLENAVKVGDAIRQGLAAALAGVTGVVEIRGMGMMIGIELDRPCGELVKIGARRGPGGQRHRRQRDPPAAAAGHDEVEAQPAGRTTGAARSRSSWRAAPRNPARRGSAELCPEPRMAKLRHFLQFKDFTREEFEYLFERTRIIKQKFKSYQHYWPLTDRTLVMIFEKASTRTRLSFEAGMQQLGGSAIYLNTRDSQLGRGEPVEDAAQVISRMCDIVMIRTFEQSIIERFAANSRVPVINGLTNEYHPCQILADIYTYIEQRGSITGQDRGVDRRLQQRVQHLAAGRGNTRLQRACLDPARLRSRAGARRIVRRGSLRGIHRPDAKPRAAPTW